MNLGKFVKIQPGSFIMGSPENEPGHFNDETQHKVTLTQEFEICTTQVTQDQWEKIMGSNPSMFKGENHPVENVSWNDTQAFIAKLNESQNEFHYRLPTEAEWEYCAGKNDSKDLDAQAWYYSNSASTTHPVGTKKPNALGLYDMLGNVWEWCQDWYGKYPNE